MQEYSEIEGKIKQSRVMLDSKSEIVPKMQEEVRSLKEKYKSMNQAQDLRQKLNKLKDEMAWAQVDEIETVQNNC